MLDYDLPQSLLNKKKPTKNDITRNAMGEYIVPSGGKPLTSLGESNPGPAEYLPKLDFSKRVGPQYSLSGPDKKEPKRFPAGPGDLNISRDSRWRHKYIHVKGKGQTRPYDVRDKSEYNDSVGPAYYKTEVSRNDMSWELSPRWSMGQKHRDGVNAGHPNKTVHPVDTHRHPNPAPNKYMRSSEYSGSEFKGKGPEYSFGEARIVKTPDGPGPTDYDALKDTSGEPGKTFGVKLPPVWNQQKDCQSDGPGPGKYAHPTYMGTGYAKTISELPPEVEWDPAAPPPNIYVIPDLMGSTLAPHTAQVNWRPITPEIKKHPGPDTYNPNLVDLKKDPAFSLRGQTKASFPEVLQYPTVAHRESSAEPGPGTYDQTHGMLHKNGNPKFSMGKRLKSSKNPFPGPNHYWLKNPEQPNKVKGPSFSFGSQLTKIDKRCGPGPAAYLPKLPKSKVAFSLHSRPKVKMAFPTPAPSKYVPIEGQNHKGLKGGSGITFKGRPSPFMYSGRTTTRIIEPVQ